MSVTLTITELAAELRIGDGETAPVEPIAGILTRHLQAARREIMAHAPTAPDPVMDIAAIRLIGYRYFQPPARAGMSFAHALVNSGAADALREWRIPPSAVIDYTGSEVEPAPVPEPEPVELPPVFYVGWLDTTADTDLTDAVLQANGQIFALDTDDPTNATVTIPQRPAGSAGDLRQFFALPVDHPLPTAVLIQFGSFQSIGGIGAYTAQNGPFAAADGRTFYALVSNQPLTVDALAGRNTRLAFEE